MVKVFALVQIVHCMNRSILSLGEARNEDNVSKSRDFHLADGSVWQRAVLDLCREDQDLGEHDWDRLGGCFLQNTELPPRFPLAVETLRRVRNRTVTYFTGCVCVSLLN